MNFGLITSQSMQDLELYARIVVSWLSKDGKPVLKLKD